jgi:hypothetical protein
MSFSFLFFSFLFFSFRFIFFFVAAGFGDMKVDLYGDIYRQLTPIPTRFVRVRYRPFFRVSVYANSPRAKEPREPSNTSEPSGKPPRTPNIDRTP